MAIAISILALAVAVYAAVVARDTRSSYIELLDKFGEIPVRQPQDQRTRTLDD